MKKRIVIAAILLVVVGFKGNAQQVASTPAPKVTIVANEKTPNSQWQGKRVAYLGDSMTDKRRAGTTCVYWEYLTELLGIEPSVYGISGNQWDGIYKQALKMHEEKGAKLTLF
jgi:hypothetical protein